MIYFTLFLNKINIAKLQKLLNKEVIYNTINIVYNN